MLSCSRIRCPRKVGLWTWARGTSLWHITEHFPQTAREVSSGTAWDESLGLNCSLEQCSWDCSFSYLRTSSTVPLRIRLITTWNGQQPAVSEITPPSDSLEGQYQGPVTRSIKNIHDAVLPLDSEQRELLLWTIWSETATDILVLKPGHVNGWGAMNMPSNMPSECSWEMS